MRRRPRLNLGGPPVHGWHMESHEWTEQTSEGKHYYRGNFLGGSWTVITTTQKRNPEWTVVSEPPEEIWRALRGVVWRKYQRKRCPWERVAQLDRILGDEPQPRG